MNRKKAEDPAIATEHSCFVFGLELDGKGGGKPVDGLTEADQPQWLHIDYSSPDAERWLKARGLDSAVIETLVRSESRPRTTPTKGGLLVVLRGINMNPGADPEDMVFFPTSALLVSHESTDSLLPRVFNSEKTPRP